MPVIEIMKVIRPITRAEITGWKSIRIYDHVAIVGESETLHEKRMQYMAEHNET